MSLADTDRFLQAVMQSLMLDLARAVLSTRTEKDVRDTVADVFASYSAKLTMTPKARPIGFITGRNQ
jgi:hypothetical protein